jgi:hypothetical protein
MLLRGRAAEHFSVRSNEINLRLKETAWSSLLALRKT